MERGQETRRGPGKGHRGLTGMCERTHVACHQRERRLLCMSVIRSGKTKFSLVGILTICTYLHMYM